eukprot:CAMPEP_0184389456 /NCGR_PEP_ID=MMETSP0007-20130409/12496_1 /TAXON_ID=97485 /ORGANISM="Prymnesium parvum, Strain Texoma1" /LENGTH=41 /DNA_ID= /DNA_START= /DNA_END= /DNA_ORIENTATION=
MSIETNKGALMAQPKKNLGSYWALNSAPHRSSQTAHHTRAE